MGDQVRPKMYYIDHVWSVRTRRDSDHWVRDFDLAWFVRSRRTADPICATKTKERALHICRVLNSEEAAETKARGDMERWSRQLMDTEQCNNG